MAESFVHLHVHTEYSMLDGAAKHKPLFAEVQKHGMPAVAMTDHGNMFGAYEFYQHAVKTGVKPIIGIEAYVSPTSRHHKQAVFFGGRESQGDDVSGRGAYTHMTIWARNATGLRNLFALSSRASFEGFFRKPRMDRELIAEYAEGLMATTGCPGGEIPTRLRLGLWDEAVEAASAFRDIFGPENYFVELMDHGSSIDRQHRQDMLKLAEYMNLRKVVTHDSHYVTPDQADAHAALLCVQTNSTLDDPKRFKFEGSGYHIASAEEMRKIWDAEVPDACDATLEIADRVESYAEVFDEQSRMPRVQLAPGETEEAKLRAEVEEYLPTRYPNGISQEYRDRIEWELQVICGKGYASYFLVVGDLVRWAKAQGIRVGPGRGSATGALVSYILHIINLDPIEHSLIFERFLNPERDSPPDIDLDFDDRRRDEVMAYTRDKYGSENVAQVITFGTIKTKAALKDAARAHFGQQGFQLADRLSKALPPPVAAEDIPLKGIIDESHERYKEATEIRQLLASEPAAKTTFDTALGLEGLIRNAGVHACAYILSSQPLLEVLPLWARPDDGAIITGWDYPACESIGLLKMDFLGLSTLTIIGDAIDAVRENHGIEIDLDTLALDDKQTYELLARGDTLGVFQLDGSGMRSLVKAMKPTHFGDVSAAIALYRPGPMAANAHIAYAERSNGRAPAEPIHPELKDALEPILGESYHLLVYQEQVMAIAQQLAGYTLGEADLLRKAMGKKKPEVIAKESAKFIGGMKEKGFSEESAQTLWDTILPFAGYAFNKSHTAGYALVAYWTAYLKAHYPAEFMAAQLTSNANNKDKSAIYLAECRRMGVKVLPPDVNESKVAFAAVDGNIRFGLGAIRNVGSNVAQAIVDTRQQKGQSTDVHDFLAKVPVQVCNKRLLESLAKAGAFDELGSSRSAVVAAHEECAEFYVATKRQEAIGQDSLFGDFGGGDDDSSVQMAPRIPDLKEWDKTTLLAHEREMLGLYVSDHPLNGTERVLAANRDTTIADLLGSERTDGEVQLSGLITKVERRVTKKGDPWAIVTIEDLDASIEALFFPSNYQLFAMQLVEDSVVSVSGRINDRDGTISIFAQQLEVLDTSNTDLGAPVTITMRQQQVTEPIVQDLKVVLGQHRGQTPLQLAVQAPDGKTTRLTVPDWSIEPDNAFAADVKALLGAQAVQL